MKLLLFGLHIRIDLQLVFDYLFAYPHETGGGLCEDIIVLVKELQETCLLLWTHFSAKADSHVRYSRVEYHFLEITFILDCFFELC
jgi:hypothetical protein